MDEILASIRKIISDDGQGVRALNENAAPVMPAFAAPAPAAPVPEALEPDIDLPSMFRVSAPAPAPERAPPLLNRLADALRGSPSPAGDRPLEPARSLEEDLADLLEGPSLGRGAASPPQAAPRSAAPANFALQTPQARRLLASLDESLARLGAPAAPSEATREPASQAPAAFAISSAASYESSPANPQPALPAAKAAAADPKTAPRPADPAAAPAAEAKSEQKSATGVTPPDARPASLAPPADAKPLQPKPLTAANPAEGKSSEVKPGAKAGEAKPPPPGASVISGADLFINGVAGKADGALNGGLKSGGTGVLALDSVLGELLRPILKQWLDENMPRLVAEIVRAEYGEVLRAAANGKQRDG